VPAHPPQTGVDPSANHGPGAASASLAAPLRIENLVFRYSGSGFGVSVASLQLAPAEQVLLTGGSGSGKSTILHLVAGLIDGSGGRILVAGTDITRLSPGARDHFRGRHLGMIFQTFNLLQGFSALENVMVAMMFSDIPPREHRPRAAELLSSLGITSPASPVEQLSVGQQQRVAVARAVACSPALVLADEPTASLDPDNAQDAMDVIQGSCRRVGAALLCVSHDPSLASRFERRIALADLNSAPAPQVGAAP